LPLCFGPKTTYFGLVDLLPLDRIQRMPFLFARAKPAAGAPC
jgi:hypothetical protein